MKKNYWKRYLFYVRNHEDFKRIRVKLNLTQKQYGDLIGITRQSVNNIETDNSIKLRPVLLVALNYSLKDLYSDKLVDDLYTEDK